MKKAENALAPPAMGLCGVRLQQKIPINKNYSGLLRYHSIYLESYNKSYYIIERLKTTIVVQIYLGCIAHSLYMTQQTHIQCYRLTYRYLHEVILFVRSVSQVNFCFIRNINTLKISVNGKQFMFKIQLFHYISLTFTKIFYMHQL